MKNQDKEPRITLQGVKILRYFIDHEREHSGADIAKCTGLKSGTLYPLLKKFECAGWLKSRWENIDPSKERRPRRHLYSITEIGAAIYRENIVELLAQ